MPQSNILIIVKALMNKHQCKPITVYEVKSASSKSSVTEKKGDYTATYKGRAYNLPQEFNDSSACAPVVYGDGCCPDS